MSSRSTRTTSLVLLYEPCIRAPSMESLGCALCVELNLPSSICCGNASFGRARSKICRNNGSNTLRHGTCWQRGMVQSIFYIQEGGVGTFVTEGLWTPQDTFAVPAGHALALAVAQTCKDVRHNALCVCDCLVPCLLTPAESRSQGHCSGQGHEGQGCFLRPEALGASRQGEGQHRHQCACGLASLESHSRL